MLNDILPPLSSIAVVTVMAAVFGVLLSIAMLKLKVDRDHRVAVIREALPGANCGACGLPGCSAYATKIVEDKFGIDLCMVGGNETARAIARIMGDETPREIVRNTARVHCRGGRAETTGVFRYSGLRDCSAANGVMGGFKTCRYGCLGFGDCMRACPFNAIRMSDNGLPVVDRDACTGCGLCVPACPRGIMELAPRQNDIHVMCSNREKASVMKLGCSVGCIACRLCEKACRQALSAKFPDRDPSLIELAIRVDDFLARINYDLCIQCYECVRVCPVPVINPLAKSKKYLESANAQGPGDVRENSVEVRV
jgi:electron transport complex protein RnfB